MIFVLNAGSSSIKFAAYSFTGSDVGELRLKGSVTGIGREVALEINGAGIKSRNNSYPSARTFTDCLQLILDAIPIDIRRNITGLGHRVVHGGPLLSSPVRITETIITQLESLTPFAPLHQPKNINTIRFFLDAFPHALQIVSFDTSFHETQNSLSKIIPIPKKFRDEGIRNYGFHGISYEYISSLLARDPSVADKKTIIAHLGSGASMCALKNGKSVATTMGFSTLNGLVMSTRSGNIDPGVLLYLRQHHHLSDADIEKLLYTDSGLVALAGDSGDMQTLLTRDDEEARLAVDLFVYRAIREIGSLSAALGGLEVLIFTGGIGEHASQVREKICAGSYWLGIRLQSEGVGKIPTEISISSFDSSVIVKMIPTDENKMIASHVANYLKKP